MSFFVTLIQKIYMDWIVLCNNKLYGKYEIFPGWSLRCWNK